MSISTWEFYLIRVWASLVPFLISWTLQRSFLSSHQEPRASSLLLENMGIFFFLRLVAFSNNRYLLLVFLDATLLTKKAGPDIISSQEKYPGFDMEQLQ